MPKSGRKSGGAIYPVSAKKNNKFVLTGSDVLAKSF
jgi:hypothetical protein